MNTLSIVHIMNTLMFFPAEDGYHDGQGENQYHQESQHSQYDIKYDVGDMDGALDEWRLWSGGRGVCEGASRRSISHAITTNCVVRHGWLEGWKRSCSGQPCGGDDE